MRKIEQQMIEAINNKVAFSQSNTQVVIIANSAKVFLHGNFIAAINLKLRKVSVSNCGWKSNVTKSRINAIANNYGLAGINQKAGVWYVSGVPFTKYNEFKKSLPCR